MTESFKKLLDSVNEKIKDKPLIYFTREAERAIGLELLLENYHICCIEDSDIVSSLKDKGISIFCLEREGIELLHKSTGNLLSQTIVTEWIKKITNGSEFFAITFIPTNTLDYKIKSLGGKLLGNPYELHQSFENKISQATLLNTTAIRTPKNKSKYFHELSHDEVIKEFGDNFVLQEDRAHTGSGTYITPNKDEFQNLLEKNTGNIVKISEYIDGIPLTLNVCVFNNSIYIGGLQYQITGIPDLTKGSGSTVGNDFDWFYTKAISDELLVDLTTEISKIGKLLISNNYKGLFGLDMIVKEENAYLIEINARQSANIPFQTQLELNNTDSIPLLLMHIADLLDIKHEFHYDHMPRLKGSQIFLRAKEDLIMSNHNLISGVYRLQSDNSSMDWSKDHPEQKDNVIYMDEEGDKPLVLQKTGYRIEDANENAFLIHFQKSNSSKRGLDELCRMQFNYGIINENQQPSPWILEAMNTIRREVS